MNIVLRAIAILICLMAIGSIMSGDLYIFILISVAAIFYWLSKQKNLILKIFLSVTTLIVLVFVLGFFQNKYIIRKPSSIIAGNDSSQNKTNDIIPPRPDLLKVTDSVNKMMPLMINHETRADAVVGFADTLTYNITLLNVSKSNCDISFEENKMRNKLINGICSDRKYDLFLKNNINMKYAYHDKDGFNLFSVIVKPVDCAEQK